jgi:hypothetical protein
MSDPRITYTLRPDGTRESEMAALAAVYRFVLDCHAKKEAAHASGPDNEAKEFKHDCPVTPNHTK